MNITSNLEIKRPAWQNFTMLALGFWLSASLILDWVIMPSLYVSGMMAQDGFASAGYLIFWVFNRVELLCAGLVLTGILTMSYGQLAWYRGAIFLAGLMLTIALVDTYLLTPQMSAIGIHLNQFAATVEVPATMNLLHGAYWVLDVMKLVTGGVLLGWCSKN
ncbi:hypothetical protein [Calothrix sp. PCC 6303]|uniref:hypothetical protein n=1 Tax=Calothrix sp. PCC 6303 TaxID=1170562 RepID=UPI0002A040A5|nr:hypothetical protein [Calothrix sp. PCC 6303]AFY99229.1 hypothetical protein Cal6303_0121 [Calothrix sp. PCC 6303]